MREGQALRLPDFDRGEATAQPAGIFPIVHRCADMTAACSGICLWPDAGSIAFVMRSEASDPLSWPDLPGPASALTIGLLRRFDCQLAEVRVRVAVLKGLAALGT
ncbi:MAG: hypothetical protein KF887_03530 [Paracoccaceae bacterium]|nr:MAG: hypothetical protein KF887_03530 [Paracoccaceae bacterium]